MLNFHERIGGHRRIADHRRRRLNIERLEDRRLLAVTIAQNLWTEPSDTAIADVDGGVSYLTANNYDLLRLNRDSLQSALLAAPLEFTASNDSVTIELPNNRGSVEQFEVAYSPIYAAGFAEEFPEIRTYVGHSLSDPSTIARFGMTYLGFHASVHSPSGSYQIRPYYYNGAGDLYAVYSSYQVDPSIAQLPLRSIPLDELIQSEDDQDAGADSGQSEQSPTTDDSSGGQNILSNDSGSGSNTLLQRPSGTNLRVYRIAISANRDYASRAGGTMESVQSSIVALLDHVNLATENDLSVRLELIANNDLLTFLSSATDPFTRNSLGANLDENQELIDQVIGSSNYDIGHVLIGIDQGGLAATPSLGSDFKAAAASSGPPGDYLDGVAAHEMGHQMGANHTFSGIFGGCSGNGNEGTAVEPGSGSTIMSYAGLCFSDDIESELTEANFYYHSTSIEEIFSYLDDEVPTVGTRISTGNVNPTVQVLATGNLIIPANTPFLLEAKGYDVNNPQDLTYSWEQTDAGVLKSLALGDTGRGSIIRSIPATPSSTRYIPRLSDLANGTTTRGEILPTTTRRLNFRVTARDNFGGAGATNTDDLPIISFDNGKLFSVTSPTETGLQWEGLTEQTIRWDVAETNLSPIDASEVSILWSTDGGLSFPYVAALRVPNSGRASIFVPNITTNRGRFMIRAYDNIFFTVSTTDIAVQAAQLAVVVAPTSTQYRENSPPVAIASQSVATVAERLSGLIVTVSMQSGDQIGDRILIMEDDSIGVLNDQLFFNDVAVASVIPTDSGLFLQFNANATLPILESVLRSFGFANSTDNPGNTTRQVEVTVGHLIRQLIEIDVQPVNDAPVIAPAVLPTILEDTTEITGRTVSELFGESFSDPDQGASLSGIAVVGNPRDARQGAWYYSTGSVWAPIGVVDDVVFQLVLPPEARLGFLPRTDYFGTPDPLRIRALDDTYTSSFSSVLDDENGGEQRVYFRSEQLTTISEDTVELSIEILNVNDPPFANVSRVVIEIFQDQPIDRQISEDLFGDTDSTFTLGLAGTDGSFIPSWLSFDPETRVLAGTPGNADVGTYQLALEAFDGQFTATIPLAITVVNVNDAPVGVRYVAMPVLENVSEVQIGTLYATDPEGDLVTWTSSDPRVTIQGDQVLLDAAIDYETVQSFPVTFVGTDSGDPALSAALDVTIEIVDVNEFYPQLVGETFTILSGTAAGTLATQVDAPDGDTLQTVRFRLVDGDVDAFQLDPVSGDLTFVVDADANIKAEYKVFIEAYDNGVPQRAKAAQFVVQVTPLNEFPPILNANQRLTFAENLGSGAEVGQIIASDADGTPLEYKVIEVVGGQLDWVTVDSNTGVLRVTSAAGFDFESGVQYAVRVRVTETIEPGRSVEMLIPITLSDANDRPSRLEPTTIYTSRTGATGSPITVVDQDLSTSGYTLSTVDPRFEFRDGVFSLRPDFYFDASLAGTTTSTTVHVVDRADPSSFVDLNLTVQIVLGRAWQNPVNARDVNRDGRVSPQDALIVINELNAERLRQLTIPRPFDQLDLPDFDSNGDDRISPIDALLIINFLNGSSQAEGESPSAEGESTLGVRDSSLWLSAYMELENERRRR